MAAAVARRLFTVADYERMVEAGIFAEDERIELIGGEIVYLSPIGPRHTECVLTLTEFLVLLVGRAFRISVQNAIRLVGDGQPQPDIAVLHRRHYGRSLPTAADVLLVIEVADTSCDYDRGVKFPIYAAAGIAESWLVDLVSWTIERHTDPSNGRYRQIAIAGRGETLASTVLPDLAIAVDEILR